MSTPADFWIRLLPRNENTESAAATRHDYCRKVLNLLEKKHPDLFMGKSGATLSFDEAQTLVSILQKNTFGYVFKQRVSYLVRGLEYGTLELNWDVAIPPPPMVIPRDKPRFTHEEMAKLPVLYQIEEAFLSHLAKPPPDTITNRFGQLLLSAILYGGIFQKRWLSPWVEALSKVYYENNVLWMNLLFTSEHEERERQSIRSQGRKPQEPDRKQGKTYWEISRRWFADPLTSALIMRWLNKFPGDQITARPMPEKRNRPYEISPLAALNSYICHLLKIPIRETDAHVQVLLLISSTRLGLQVPPFLVAYAEGKNKSVSLKQATWERLLFGKIPVITSQLESPEGPVAAVDRQLDLHVATKAAPMAEQEKLLKRVLQIILPAGKSRKRIVSEAKGDLKQFYENNKERMCQSLALLTFWSMDLLTHYAQKDLLRGRVRSSIKAKSVRTYLDTIGRRLVAAAGQLEILALESDEYHDLYREVIDSCPTDKTKSKAGKRLRGFHEFLICRFGAPKVDFSDLMINSGPAELNVDANLITFTDFDNMQQVLSHDYSKASRIRKIQYLISMLGFRCGLRPREALKLRIIDVLGEAETEILVRNNRYAYVKSGESIRRIPAHLLLTENELKLLLAWRWDRKLEDEYTIPESLLFCLNMQPTTLLSDHLIFPQIEQAMRQVSGDSTLTYHNLRHSFATLLTLRLIRDFSEYERKSFHFLKHKLFETAACDTLRKSLLGNMSHGRRTLYAVAQLCGHAGPEVTILHYIHLCDWLLSREVSRPENQPKLDAARIMTITNIPLHILYYGKNRDDSEDWYISQYLEHITVPLAKRPVSDMQKPDLKTIPEKATSLNDTSTPLWRLVEAVIREGQLGRLSYDTLAKRSGLPESDIVKWCRNAATLAAMKTSHGKLRHVIGITQRNNPNFNFPLRLHLAGDKKIAGRIITNFCDSHVIHKKKLFHGIQLFIERFSASDRGITFRISAEARSHIRFLKFISISEHQIKVTRILPSKSSKSHDKEQVKFAKYFELPINCIVCRNLYAQEYSTSGEFLIQVVNQPLGANANGKVKASYGFRFAMYMIAIIYGSALDSK